jgi:hypothetical protein
MMGGSMTKDILDVVARKARLRTHSGQNEVARLTVETIITSKTVEVQDSGQAVIVDLGGVECTFFRFQSWDEKMQHHLLRGFIGKKVRLTLEVVK